MSEGPRVAVADGFTQLVAHVFAHVALEHAGNTYDSRYVAWAREHLPARAGEMVEHDAAVIGARWRGDRRLDVLHGLFELHGDLDAFRRTASRSLAELDAGDVRSPQLLVALREADILPITELLHTTLALLADDFAAALARLSPQLESARSQLESIALRLAAVVPEFEGARIELVWALGMHGRAFPDRILVGVPTSWSGCSPARQAVLAAHEYCVRASPLTDYVGSEWDALTTLARALHRAADVELVDAHARWLAELDLDVLLAGVIERSWLSAESARALRNHPLGRADWLSR